MPATVGETTYVPAAVGVRAAPYAPLFKSVIDAVKLDGPLNVTRKRSPPVPRGLPYESRAVNVKDVTTPAVRSVSPAPVTDDVNAQTEPTAVKPLQPSAQPPPSLQQTPSLTRARIDCKW